MALTTPIGRLSFPSVFQKKLNTLSKKEEYSMDIIFEADEDLSELKKAAEEALMDKFGSDKSTWPVVRNPFRDQSKKVNKKSGNRYDGYGEEGKYLTLRCKDKPQVVDKKLNPIVEESDLYSGCWVRASVNVYAYDKGGNTGVNFSLSNVQKVKDDTPFGTRTTATMDFEPVDSAASSSEGESMFD